ANHLRLIERAMAAGLGVVLAESHARLCVGGDRSGVLLRPDGIAAGDFKVEAQRRLGGGVRYERDRRGRRAALEKHDALVVLALKGNEVRAEKTASARLPREDDARLIYVVLGEDVVLDELVELPCRIDLGLAAAFIPAGTVGGEYRDGNQVVRG